MWLEAFPRPPKGTHLHPNRPLRVGAVCVPHQVRSQTRTQRRRCLAYPCHRAFVGAVTLLELFVRNLPQLQRHFEDGILYWMA